MKRFGTYVCAGVLLACAATATATGGTLDDVKARGAVRCGVHIEKAGFSTTDSGGRISGFDIDFCRAIAAAIGASRRSAPRSASRR
jgi:general L-amino acid transport system substrate-binding protein